MFLENTENIPRLFHKTTMDELEKWLRHLVTETCRHPPDSIERQRGLTQIVRVIVKSGQLWRDSAPYYEDALQQTWLYFCRNLCETTTSDQYDPQRSNVMTWLNTYLKWRLRDCYIQEQTKRAQTISKTMFGANDLMETLEAPPDVPSILEVTKQWIETDQDGELRCTHIQGHPEVTCQVLLLRRLPPETSWQSLAKEFGLSVSTLSSFYRRHCISRLRRFGQSQAYL